MRVPRVGRRTRSGSAQGGDRVEGAESGSEGAEEEAKQRLGQARLEARAACRVALASLARQRLLAEDERIRIEIYLKDNLP